MTPRSLLTTLAVLCACSGQAPKPAPVTEAMYPWSLRSPSSLPGNFLWQQRLSIRVGRDEHSLQAVLQKTEDHMVLLGLTPFGTKAFVLDQRGSDVTFQSFFDRQMPFPPRFMLIDVQRAYLPLGAADEVPQDGEQRWQMDGEEVVQTYAAGRLVMRTFRRLDGHPAGILRITYQHRTAAGVPDLITLENGWFGYSLVIATLAVQALPAEAVGP